MKVVALRAFDSEPEVTEVDVPQPGSGEVGVRVHAASVNGFDLSVAKGANPAPATLDRLARNQAEQHTTVTVQHVYDLEQAPDAFGHFAAGTLGKIIISIA